MMRWSGYSLLERGIKMTLNLFIKTLKSRRSKLTTQQYKTLKGQAIAGDISGANKGLIKLLGGELRNAN